MFRRFFSAIFLLPAFVMILPPVSAAQAHENSSSTSSAAKSSDVSGKWQVAWRGRLGTEQCTLQLEQASSNTLKGTLQDLRGISSLSGTIDGKKISFDVQFQGPHPFTTRFTGTVDDDKIAGTSQAINVGGTGAFLGHGGEVVQPEHPWTAKRVVNQPSPSAETSPNPPARN